MPGKCSAYGCRTGYNKKRKVEEEAENVAKFHFPLKKPELLEKWKKKSNMNEDLGKSAVFYEKHFKECYIRQG